MPKQVQLRRGTTTQHTGFTGAEAEITVDTDLYTIRVHDGVTAGGHRLAKYTDITGNVGGGNVTSVNGQTGVVVLTTANVDEGANLYFTDTRARTAVQNGVLANLTISGNLIVDSNVLYIDTIYDRVGIGTTSPSNNLSINSSNQLLGLPSVVQISHPSGNWGLTLKRNTDETGHPNFSFVKSRAETYKQISQGDALGRISWHAALSNTSVTQIAELGAVNTFFNGTNADSVIYFSTTSGSTGLISEKLRIDGIGNVGVSGNVGIGTLVPIGPLHLVTGTPTGATSPLATSHFIIDSSANQYIEMRTTAGSSGLMQGLLFTDNGRNAFIGYKEYTGGTASTYGEALHFVVYDYSGTDPNNGFYFGTSTTPQSGISTAHVFIKADGKVGMGTVSPTTKLDVAGNARIGHFVDTPALTVSGIQVPLNIIGGSTGYTQGAISISSNVSDSPGSRGQGVFLFNEGNDTTWYMGTAYGAADTFYISRKGSTTSLDPSAAWINASGGTALLTLTNGGALTVTSLTESSSITFKENVNPIQNALDSIIKLVGVTYDRKDGSAKNKAGLIKEDVEKVLPNLVNDHGIHYTNIIAYLVESIKELKTEIDTLKGNHG